MDTKQKNPRSDSKRQSRSAAQNTSGTKRRSSNAPQRRQRSAEPTPRRGESAAKRPEQARRRPPENQSRSAARRTAQQPRRAENTARPVKSDAPEQVFKPAEIPIRTRDPEVAKRTEQRRRSAQRAKERQEQMKRRMNRPAVVYTQPKPVNVNRLLLQIVVVMAVVLAVVMGLSVFFKVDQVVVYGNEAYSAWAVQEAAGIEGGENLMTFNGTRASGKIIATLPYVKNARIGIKLPDTVNIYIEEFDVAYAIQSQNGTWWLMTSAGNVVEQIDAGTAGGYTKVLGVELDNPSVGEPAKAVDEITAVTEEPAETSGEGTEPTVAVPASVLVTGSERLNAALVVLAALEANDIVGEAASVDVTSLSDMELWYGQQYQVKLGGTGDMVKKISWMKSAIAQRKEYDMGVLDVSFTTWTDQVGFTPFES